MSKPSNHFWRFAARHWPLRKGRGRVYRMAWERLHGRQIFRDDFGNRLLLDLDSFIDAHIALDGAFEKKSIEVLLRLARERACTVFIDVGANIGAHTLPFAAQTGITKVYAFEPDPENFRRLKANIDLNGRTEKVALSRVALSSRAGEADFFITRALKEVEWNKLNRGTHSLTMNPDRHTDSFRVETRPLDDMLDLKSQSIAIKIDVEGHEADVLDGMTRLLAENNCVIHMEIFSENLARVESRLSGLGYSQLSGLILDGSNHVYVRE